MRKNEAAVRRPAEARWGYVFIAPILLFLLIFLVFPIVQVAYYSLTSWDGRGAASWVGLQNYVELFRSKEFWTVLKNNLYFLLVGVPVWTIFPLLIAVLLHEEVKGWKFFKSAFFFPSVLSTAVVGVLFTAFLNYNGPFNEILRSVGLDALALDWLAQGTTSIPAIILIINWAGFGSAVLIYLAGLSSVPNDVQESAVLDGAGWFRRLFYITIPMIKSVIQLNILLNIIYAFTSLFSYIFVMTSGGPGYESTVIEYLLYRKAFQSNEVGSASALAIIMFAIVFVISRLQARLFAASGNEEE
ncbi:carbohydrate ABC transporter permease [Paenibacillus sp. GCM10012307]|uniref:Sugar ABC transporter permease n=1 Tax=Paenibacillus roseus TaxID=2798579 RepID=A0A934J664_9BACL|nr:sugar ABC transporter permease [Paenibacillus roseus]MBJ6361491.1 sugar ABC transporter permease [Paenibacillus roseus]